MRLAVVCLDEPLVFLITGKNTGVVVHAGETYDYKIGMQIPDLTTWGYRVLDFDTLGAAKYKDLINFIEESK